MTALSSVTSPFPDAPVATLTFERKDGSTFARATYAALNEFAPVQADTLEDAVFEAASQSWGRNGNPGSSGAVAVLQAQDGAWYTTNLSTQPERDGVTAFPGDAWERVTSVTSNSDALRAVVGGAVAVRFNPGSVGTTMPVRRTA